MSKHSYQTQRRRVHTESNLEDGGGFLRLGNQGVNDNALPWFQISGARPYRMDWHLRSRIFIQYCHQRMGGEVFVDKPGG
ncbi:hypothetical protein D3C75_866800 [compost metagenome]